MRTSLLHFAAIGFVISSTIGISAQSPQRKRWHMRQNNRSRKPQSRNLQHMPREAADNPVADPKAVIVWAMQDSPFSRLS